MICRRAPAYALAALALGTVGAGAQNTVELRMRPRLGDTLYLQLDQRMAFRGRPVNGDSLRTMGASMRVVARAIPTAATSDATTLTAITDSLVVSTDASAAKSPLRASRPIVGRHVQIRVLHDGAFEIVDPTEFMDDPSPLFAAMPPILPRGAVRVGDRWTREMPLPVRGNRTDAASVRATFHLDSLGRDGRMAYISVRGSFYERPSGSRGPERPIDGNLTGAFEFDREMGWITDSRATVTMRTDVPAARARRPMTVWMTVTQHLQARTTR